MRSAQPAPMSALIEFMNRVPPPLGRSVTLAGPSTGMSRAFTSVPWPGQGGPGERDDHAAAVA
jgi:hypothetical protein